MAAKPGTVAEKKNEMGRECALAPVLRIGKGARTKKAARFLAEENLAELGECSCSAETCSLKDHPAGKQMVWTVVRF
jgi:hypothetical protein